MLPTHDEFVLIAATNQPAVQAVAEAVGTPTVPGTPPQTPLSATLAWVGIPSDGWDAFNEELSGVTRVRGQHTHSVPDEEGVTVAQRTDGSGAGLGTRKVCMRTVLDQRVTTRFPLWTQRQSEPCTNALWHPMTMWSPSLTRNVTELSCKP